MGMQSGLFDGAQLTIFWMVAVDFRCGAERLLVRVREVWGRDPLDGSAFVFRNQRSTRIKMLVVDAHGVWLATRRLHEGHYAWVSSLDTLASLGRDQFRWLCAGVDWRRLTTRQARDRQAIPTPARANQAGCARPTSWLITAIRTFTGSCWRMTNAFDHGSDPVTDVSGQ